MIYGQVPERPNGLGCKPSGSAFRGSNPRLPTIAYTSAVAGKPARYRYDLRGVIDKTAERTQ